MLITAIDHCLKDIRLLIPIELLDTTFKQFNDYKYTSLDAIIKEHIIVDIVLRKTSLYSGKMKKIVLKDDYITYLKSPDILFSQQTYPLYVIPPEVRENKDIISPIGVSYPITSYGNDFYTDSQYDSLQNKTNDLFDNTFSSDQPTPTPFLLDNNTIKLEPPQIVNVEWILTCLLAYDKNFTNIGLNMIAPLSKLCVYATKAYIYNKLKIPVNDAYIKSGAELGAFKEVLESYSDAYEKFEEALLDFRGAATFDKEQTVAYFSLMNM